MIQSIFGKWSAGLSKTRESLVGKIQRVVSARSTIDDETLDALEEVLIASDVGVDASLRILERIRERVREDKYISSQELAALLRDEIAAVLREAYSSQPPNTQIVTPHVIMVVGVNGAGKTTTVAKLAWQYRSGGKQVLVGAADTFRAAANEQLETWVQRAGVEMVRQAPGADPAAVAFDTIGSALSRRSDVVVIDTAGRLHTRVNLMEELRKIRRAIEKKMQGAPHETYLVIDATTGQNGLQQAKQFRDAAGVTGVVLTKLDGTAKGGIVLAISQELGIPVRYVGVGEQMDDLQPFDPEAFVDALFEDHLSFQSPKGTRPEEKR